ncbi:MAG: hypothetical protein ACYSTZ_03590 [Planctomycetota bacterium]|jgi:hypothetical protein
MILERLMELAHTAQEAAPGVGEFRSGLGGTLLVIALGLLLVSIFVVKWGLIIWGIVWLVRYLKGSREERRRFRLELGKLAEEVHQLRHELKPCEKGPADKIE